jgi:hypothetical protein
MAKKETKSTLYPKSDYDEIVRLRGIAHANHNDMESIFRLYKLYVNPAITSYKVNCQCSDAIHNLYWELLNWFSGNTNKFEQ